MQTSTYAKDANFTCDCCDARVTRKGGRFPFYLCDKHAAMTLSEIVRLKAAKHGSSEKWIRDTIAHEAMMSAEYGPAQYDERGRPLPDQKRRGKAA